MELQNIPFLQGKLNFRNSSTGSKIVKLNFTNFQFNQFLSNCRTQCHEFFNKLNFFELGNTLISYIFPWNQLNSTIFSMNLTSFSLCKCIILQCFNSIDEWNDFIGKDQFQIYLSQPMIDSTFCNSYGGQYMSSIAPHKSYKMWNQSWVEKSGSEIDPY